MEFELVLARFKEFFDEENIEFALIGGLAMNAWGHSRLTRDADFVIGQDHQQRVLEFAGGLGYELLHLSSGYSNHLHSDHRFGRVDFMYVDSSTGRKIFDAAVRKPVIGTLELPVTSPEHLAMMKALAMKNAPKRTLFEAEDVRYLASLPGSDREAIRSYFERLGLLEMWNVIEEKG